jgi:hypothetical protein
MRFLQIWETMNQYSVSYVIDHVIFIDRVAIPVEKDSHLCSQGRMINKTQTVKSLK